MNTFRIVFQYKYNGAMKTCTIDVGMISGITNSYEISTQKAGIPTQPSQNAFAMDLGVIRTFSFSFQRIAPKNNNPAVDDDLNVDSLRWSNGFWLRVMKKFVVNRWQMETDGCKIRYDSIDSTTGESKEDEYPSIPTTNVYISEFKPSIDAGNVSVIGGSIKFKVGSTSLSKSLAKHTVLYHANYGTQATTSQAKADEDETNYVTITNYDATNPIATPVEWTSRANSEYGITNGTFKWCSKPRTSDAGAEIYTSSDSITLEGERYNEDTGQWETFSIDTLHLYAIYNYIG